MPTLTTRYESHHGLNRLDVLSLIDSVMCVANREHCRGVLFGIRLGSQGGSVTAMAINQGVLLGFVPSGTRDVSSIFLSSLGSEHDTLSIKFYSLD